MILRFTKAHRLTQLHDEILVAYPDLKGVLQVEGGVGGVAENIRLTLPDGVEDPGLTAIVSAHTPDFSPKVDPIRARLRDWAQDKNEPAPDRTIVLAILRRLDKSLVE